MSLRQPFAPRDHVVIDGNEGVVVSMTSRATILMTLDGNHLRLPNALVFRSVTLNYSRNPSRRFEFDVGIGVGEDLVAAQHIGTAELAQLPGVMQKPPPRAYIAALGDSNVQVRFLGWVDQGNAPLPDGAQRGHPHGQARPRSGRHGHARADLPPAADGPGASRGPGSRGASTRASSACLAAPLDPWSRVHRRDRRPDDADRCGTEKPRLTGSARPGGPEGVAVRRRAGATAPSGPPGTPTRTGTPVGAGAADPHSTAAGRPAEAVAPVLQVVHRVLTRFLLERTGLKPDQADSGAVTLIQRFGSVANLNVHLHCLVLDGVYQRGEAGPVFVEAPPPTDEDVQVVLHRMVGRILKMLTRHGALVEEQDSMYVADDDSDDARTLRPLQAAACTYRIAFGPRAGQKLLTVQGAMPRDPGFERELCAQDARGFSLHAAVRCESDDRQGLERLCRYITRPAPAYERVHCNAAGRVVLKQKRPWREHEHLEMSPLEFMQGLAALVPRPRLHRIRFHLVCWHRTPSWRAGGAGRARRRRCCPAEAEEDEPNEPRRWSSRISWARLLKRVFEIDMEHCPNCGGELKVIAAILETAVIERILEHLGLPAAAWRRSHPCRQTSLATCRTWRC